MKIKSLLTAALVVLVLFTRVGSALATGTNILKIQHFLVTAVPGGNFTNDTPWTVAGNPSSVAAADLIGNGYQDLICDDGNTGLTVLLNDGDGSGNFDNSFYLTVGNGNVANPTPVDVIAVDVNGDGKVDLISADSEEDDLTVLTNDGSGNFVISSTPPAGKGAFSLVAADIYGNGKPALIVADQVGNYLTVLTNMGGGIFASNAIYPVVSDPRSVTAADVNNDGKLDLICANHGSGANCLTVLTNNGSGGFVISTNITVGNNPYSVVAAHVNGTTNWDLICANQNSGTLTVLTNAGGGRFVLASSPVVGSGPVSIVAKDVNDDGKVDLICANFNDQTLTILTNAGGGHFSTLSTLPADDSSYSVITADVTGSGAADLIYSDFNLGEVSVVFSVPAIQTTFVNGSVVLAWPTNSTDGFVLQQNSSLTTTNWVNVTNAQTTVIGTNQVVDSLLNTNRFYRLMHP